MDVKRIEDIIVMDVSKRFVKIDGLAIDMFYVNSIAQALHDEFQKEENYWKEKCEILEEEREEWWSKAKCPDECYMPFSEVEKLKAEHEKEIELYSELVHGDIKDYIKREEIQPILDVYKKFKQYNPFKYHYDCDIVRMWQAIKTVAEGQGKGGES